MVLLILRGMAAMVLWLVVVVIVWFLPPGTVRDVGVEGAFLPIIVATGMAIGYSLSLFLKTKMVLILTGLLILTLALLLVI